jgi:hypothetical protein
VLGPLKDEVPPQVRKDDEGTRWPGANPQMNPTGDGGSRGGVLGDVEKRTQDRRADGESGPPVISGRCQEAAAGKERISRRGPGCERDRENAGVLAVDLAGIRGWNGTRVLIKTGSHRMVWRSERCPRPNDGYVAGLATPTCNAIDPLCVRRCQSRARSGAERQRGEVERAVSDSPFASDLERHPVAAPLIPLGTAPCAEPGGRLGRRSRGSR